MNENIARLPFRHSGLNDQFIFDADGNFVGEIFCSTVRPEFIIKACNAHDELVKALHVASDALRSYQYGNSSEILAKEAADIADSALTKVQS